MTEENKITLEMKFDGIKIINFSQSNLDFDNDKKNIIEFQTDFQFNVYNDSSKIGCLLNLKVIVPNFEEEFAELKVEFFFIIRPFDKVVLKTDDDKYGIPDALMHNLASISISTARGILFEKLRGSVLQNDIFPLINPADLFNSTLK